MSTPFGTVPGTAYVPPTLEGRALVELGATLSRERRDHDREVDALHVRIDRLEARLDTAWTAVAFWRGQALALGYDLDAATRDGTLSTDEPLSDQV